MVHKPDKKVWILRDKDIRNRAITKLNSTPIDDDSPVMKLTLEVYRKNRSAAQQALMWIWHGQWSKHFGDEVRDEHIRFKKEFLLPVLLRDDVIKGLPELYRAAHIRMINTGDYAGLYAIYELISTNALNTEQFSEILTQYEREASMEGCAFTVLGPQYEEAMGR